MSGPIDTTVVWLTWRQLFARRRLYLAAAFSLAPFLVAVIFRLTAGDVERRSAGLHHAVARDRDRDASLAAIVFGTTAFAVRSTTGRSCLLRRNKPSRWRVVVSEVSGGGRVHDGGDAARDLLPWLASSVPRIFPATVPAGDSPRARELVRSSIARSS
jgi:hypothetical protein